MRYSFFLFHFKTYEKKYVDNAETIKFRYIRIDDTDFDVITIFYYREELYW